MEQLPHPEREPRSEPEIRASVEIESHERPGIDELPERLGFTEDQEMTEARQRWIEAVKTDETDAVSEQAVAYQEQAEAAEAELMEDFKRGRELVLAGLAKGAELEEVLAEAAGLGFTEPKRCAQLGRGLQ